MKQNPCSELPEKDRRIIRVIFSTFKSYPKMSQVRKTNLHNMINGLSIAGLVALKIRCKDSSIDTDNIDIDCNS